MLEVSVGEALKKVLAVYKDRVAFDAGGKEYTYKSVHKMVNRIANGLTKLGLAKGDRLIIMTQNRIEYVFFDFAAAILGLVKVPLNVMLSNKDIEYRIIDSQAKAVVLDEFFIQKTGLFFKKYDFVEHIIRISGTENDHMDGTISFPELIKNTLTTNPKIPVFPDDLYTIIYTGGTTGKPKGVMHTNKSCLSIFFSLLVIHDIEEEEVMLLSAPLPHSTGYFIPPCLFRGGKVIITEGFNIEAFFSLVEEKAVTWTFMVPTMIYKMLDSPLRDKKNLKTLRTVCYGGAPMSPKRLENAISELGPIFIQGYAQMEVACNGTVLTKKQHEEAILSGKKKRLQSCGHPVLMAQIKIVNDAGEQVQKGKVGEILIKGPHMMSGYWNNPKETEKAIVNGWIRTGDLATVDADNFIYIVDRKKDMIITGGLNVYSSEVEIVLSKHPKISEVVVIGAPDPKWGEKIVAIVIRKDDESLTEKALIDYCKKNLSDYKVPKSIQFRQSIPKTAYGKYDKKMVRSEFWEDHERQI